MDIQWYPGHMVKAKRLLQENLKLVEVVIELLDARIPLSSKNPEFNKLLGNKLKICILNKSDLADKKQTKKWLQYYNSQNLRCLAVNSLTGEGISKVIRMLGNLKDSRKDSRIRRKAVRPLRVMVIGIPNVGKSAFINKLVGKSSAKTGDKPGITKGKQWIKIKQGIELLDTPGILWPKINEKDTGFKLAAINAIGENAFDRIELVLKLIDFLKENYQDDLNNRYEINTENLTAENILWEIGFKKGCLLKGNEVDLNSTATIILKEFRLGKITKLTMDRLPENED